MDASPPALNSNEPMGPTVPSTGGVGWGGGLGKIFPLEEIHVPVLIFS